jgi:hypothetical protein
MLYSPDLLILAIGIKSGMVILIAPDIRLDVSLVLSMIGST